MQSQLHGSWPSPLSVADVTGSSRRLSPPRVAGDGVYWKETGPDGVGRIFRTRGDSVEQLPLTFEDGTDVDVASRVHEYGGGDMAVGDGVVVFSARRDDCLYASVLSDEGWSTPAPVTPDDGVRYADLLVHGINVYAVAEEHRGNEVLNRLVVVDLETGVVRTLREGPDFVANPRPNPSGSALAWYEWNHPDMSWDSAELYVAELLDGELGEPVRIAGGREEGTSALSPAWVTDDELVFAVDPHGWWNPYRCTDPLGECRIRPLHPAEAEFAAPSWDFQGSISALDAEHVVARWTSHGRWTLGSLKLANGEAEEWVTGLEPESEVSARDGRVAFVGASATSPAVIAELQLTEGRVRIVRQSSPQILTDEYVSVAETLEWPSGDDVAHGFFYAPCNPDVTAPEAGLPPVLVLVHGGPTAATTPTFSPFVQFWTTRGFAVLDVNYRGSSGYGRAYREALNGQWGVADIEDIAAGVRFLADEGLIDGSRAFIRGGSAGGYSVLRALTATDVFAAGTSRYGIADLSLLAGDTHKFESRYTDALVGPYPEAAEVYRERSPLFHLENLTAPVLLLQGEEDKVVPPNQAQTMADAIRQAGGDVELVMYPGEGHGFRTAEAAGDALERELAFYQRVMMPQA